MKVFLKESAQIHNIIFRFLSLLVNAFTNTCSILNITFSCHSSLRKSNRFLTVFLWAYFEHTMAFFDTFSLFSLSPQQTRELRSFFYVHYPFIHTWADRLHTSRIYFQFFYFFILFLFVCLPGGSYEGKVNEFKQSKQTKKTNKKDKICIFFCSASWTSRAVQRKQETLLCIIQSLLKNAFGQNLRRPCWLCWRQFRIDGSPQRIQNVCYYLLRINNRCNRLQWLLCGKGYS